MRLLRLVLVVDELYGQRVSFKLKLRLSFIDQAPSRSKLRTFTLHEEFFIKIRVNCMCVCVNLCIKSSNLALTVSFTIRSWQS